MVFYTFYKLTKLVPNLKLKTKQYYTRTEYFTKNGLNSHNDLTSLFAKTPNFS